MPSLSKIQHEIDTIHARNRRVEMDKAWEISWARKIIVAILTYMVIVIFFWAAKLPEPWLNAIVPTVAFVLSTSSLPLFKQWWMKSKNHTKN